MWFFWHLWIILNIVFVCLSSVNTSKMKYDNDDADDDSIFDDNDDDDVWLGLRRKLTYELTSTIFLAFLGRCPVAVDSTWMTVVVAPGTGVEHGVTILLPQVAPPSPAPDHVRVGDVVRLLRQLTGLTDVSRVRNSDHGANAESKRQSTDEVGGEEDVMDRDNHNHGHRTCSWTRQKLLSTIC